MFRVGLRAFVRYDVKGNIVPSSLILMDSKPKAGDWVEIDVHLSDFSPPISNNNSKNMAFVRYDSKGYIVPGSLKISRGVPSIGNWKEVSMKKKKKTTTTTTTIEPTTTTTTIPESNIKYGYLYNGYAVTNVNGIAPDDWHVPTDAEFITLRAYIASQGWNYDGTTTLGTEVSNKQGKALATDNGWTPDAGIGTVGNTDYPEMRNISGFSGLPGGYRANAGNFALIGMVGYWYTSTVWNITGLWYRRIFSTATNLFRGSIVKTSGYSIRLIRDNDTGWSEGDKIFDYDGNVYDTVRIGTQIFTVQNLAVTHYKNGVAIPNITDGTEWINDTTGALCAYNNDESNVFITI